MWPIPDLHVRTSLRCGRHAIVVASSALPRISLRTLQQRAQHAANIVRNAAHAVHWAVRG